MAYKFEIRSKDIIFAVFKAREYEIRVARPKFIQNEPVKIDFDYFSEYNLKFNEKNFKFIVLPSKIVVLCEFHDFQWFSMAYNVYNVYNVYNAYIVYNVYNVYIVYIV